MSNAFVQVPPNSTGTKMQTFENVISGQTVDAEAVVIVDATGAPISAFTFNLTQLNSVSLGSPSAYGTAPGAVNVQGVNAYITNVPAVTQSGAWAVGQSGTWTVRNVGNVGGVFDAVAGAAVPANVLQVGGTDGTDLRALLTSSTGQLHIIIDSSAAITISGTVTDASDMTGTVPGTAPTKTGIVGGIYNSSAPSPTTGQTLPLQLDASGRLIVNVAAGSAANSAASATGSAVPANAGYTGFNASGNLVGVSAANPLPITIISGAGSGGTAITDEGTYTEGTTSFTPVGGYFQTTPTALTTTQGGAVSMTAKRALFTELHSVGGTLITLGQAVAAASIPVVLPAATTVPVVQATASTLNATVVGTGTFVTQAELQDGAGNAISSNSTTTSGKHGIDTNVLSILGTAPTTAGFLDIKGADGNVFVRQTTGSNLHTVVDSITAALPAGTNNLGKVDILGNAGAALDAAPGSAIPTNGLLFGGSDGTNLRAVATDTGGQVKVLIENSPVVSTKTVLTVSAPTAATVGTSSGLALASNVNRKGLTLVNTSANTIYLGFGANAAVVGSGIPLFANGGSFNMNEFSFTTAAVNAIASGTSSNLAIQEFTV